jgi:glycerophosphoryl diester phosphodiesterase
VRAISPSTVVSLRREELEKLIMNKPEVGLRLVREHCLAVHPYTVNTVEEMQDLISLGVDGMFTNNPDLLEGVLDADALSGEAAAQQAADAYQECRTGL